MGVRGAQDRGTDRVGPLPGLILLWTLTAGGPGWLGGGPPPSSPEDRRRYEESETRAAFLFVFAYYTEWPSQRLGAKDPFVVGVLGDSPVALALEKQASGAWVQGHRVVVKRFRTVAEAQGCHLLYFPASLERQLPEAKQRLAEEGVLTVGETNFFMGFGGAVHLFQEEGSLRFVVNRAVLDQSRLRVAARALNLAKKVIHEP